MSALGQSRHEALKSRCPLYPRKRTARHDSWMSARCQWRTLVVHFASAFSTSGSHHVLSNQGLFPAVADRSGVAREVIALLDDEFEQEWCAGFCDSDRVL